MKFYRLIAFQIILCLALVACGGNSSTEQTSVSPGIPLTELEMVGAGLNLNPSFDPAIRRATAPENIQTDLCVVGWKPTASKT